MDWVIQLLLTLLVGAVGAFIGFKIKMPAGCMVGSMFTVILLNVFTGYTCFPDELRTVMQMFSGAVIGLGVHKEDVKALRTIGGPVVILLVCMMILNVGFGAAIYSVSDLDIITSLFASAPGGMTDMAIIAGDLGANPSYVVILQLSRLILTLAILPPIFGKIVVRKRKKQGLVTSQERMEAMELDLAEATLDGALDEVSIEERGEKAVPAPIKPSAKELMPRWAITTLGAVGGGTLLYLVGMPAGAILGGMAITVLLNVTWGRCAMPSKTRHVTQTLSGAYIGTTLTAEYVRTLPQLIFPVLIMLVGVFVWCFLVGFIIHKLTKLEFETCMLACAPGGVQDMCLLADELGLETSKIAVMQTARIVGCIALFPSLLSVVSTWFV